VLSTAYVFVLFLLLLDCLLWRKQDDRLRLIRLDRTREDGGKTAVLELKNLNTLKLIRLPFNCVATFVESPPTDNQLYTLGQWASIGRLNRFHHNWVWLVTAIIFYYIWSTWTKTWVSMNSILCS